MQVQLETARHPCETQSLAVEPDAPELSEAERFPSPVAAKSRQSSLTAARLNATEKSLERIVQPLQRPALQIHRQLRHVWQLASALPQCFALIDVGAGFASLAVTLNALLKPRVVQRALRIAQPFQRPVLAL